MKKTVSKIRQLQTNISNTSRETEDLKMRAIRVEQAFREEEQRKGKLLSERSKLMSEKKRLSQTSREASRRIEEIDRRAATLLPEIKNTKKALIRKKDRIGIFQRDLVKLKGKKFKLEQEYRDFQRELHNRPIA